MSSSNGGLNGTSMPTADMKMPRNGSRAAARSSRPTRPSPTGFPPRRARRPRSPAPTTRALERSRHARAMPRSAVAGQPGRRTLRARSSGVHSGRRVQRAANDRRPEPLRTRRSRPSKKAIAEHKAAGWSSSGRRRKKRATPAWPPRVTPEAINPCGDRGRGLICLPLTEQKAARARAADDGVRRTRRRWHGVHGVHRRAARRRFRASRRAIARR